MYGLDVLFQKVLLICTMVLIGAILRKANKADGYTAKSCSNLVVYIAQPAMIIYGFLDTDFNAKILLTSLIVLIFSIAFHFMFYGVSLRLYKNSPERRRTVLRFATVFTNAGFMGIPLISELISPEAAIYATFYVISFNIFNWTLGCYLYTGNKAYIKPKKMFINPATIPTYIGLSIFILSGVVTIPDVLLPAWDGYIVPVIKDNVLFALKSTVIPLSMFIIGIRLAESDIKLLFKDRYLPLYLGVRLIILPIVCMAIMKAVALTGLISYPILQPAAIVLTISASTPAAAMAGILAEQFDGDTQYAGQIVSASTLVSLITMPIIAALLLRVFP